VKILNRILRTAGWALFLLGSTTVVFALTYRPRSLIELYRSLALVDSLYLFLTLIGSLVVAWAIDIWVHQET
jgi:hypothetical protein